MGVLILIAVIVFFVRWVFGGTSTAREKQYAKLCREQYTGKIGTDEFIDKANEIWNKHH